MKKMIRYFSIDFEISKFIAWKIIAEGIFVKEFFA